MIYEYICENEDCKNVEEINMRMTDEHPKTVVCSKCGKDCYRNFLTSSIVIPDGMKAGHESWNYEKNTNIHGRKYF